MSEIQTHVGKLVRISDFASIDHFEKWLSKKGYVIPDCKDEYPNYIIYHLWGDPKYIYFNNKFIYEILDNSLGYDNIEYFNRVNRDQYDYVFQYDDGGTCLREMLSDHLWKMKRSIDEERKDSTKNV